MKTGERSEPRCRLLRARGCTRYLLAGVEIGLDGEHGAASVYVKDGGGDLGGFVAEKINGGVSGVLDGLHAAERKAGAGLVEIGGGAALAFLNGKFAFGGD